MGQILKNYPGTIKGNLKNDLLTNIYQLGMRTLTVVYDVVEQNVEPLIQSLRHKFSKEHANVNDSKILFDARNRIAGLIFVLSYGMLRKIAFCVSHELLLTALEKSNDEDLSFKLVYQSVLLNNLGKLQSTQIIKFYDSLLDEKNKFPAALLRKMVIDHFNLFASTDHFARQKVSDRMEIAFKSAQMFL